MAREAPGTKVTDRAGQPAGSAKGRVAELRSILRFLYLQGITALRLGTAVPPVGGWRLVALPPRMTAADVERLLDSCDRGTSLGVRDFAIMMLVRRLGLRSIEDGFRLSVGWISDHDGPQGPGGPTSGAPAHVRRAPAPVEVPTYPP